MLIDTTVPSMRHRLIFFSKVDKLGYSFSFGNRLFRMMFEPYVVGNGFTSDGLYRLNIFEHVSFHTVTLCLVEKKLGISH